MKELRTVLALVAREKKDIWFSIVFGVLAGLTTVGLFGASGYLISKAALAPPLYTLIIVIAMVKLFGFTRALGRYVERLFSHRATFTILSHIRTRFFELLEPEVPHIFRKYRSGDLLARVIGDVESLQNFFLRVYYPPIVLLIVFLSTIIFTAFFSWMLALLFFLGLVIVGVVIPFIATLKQRKSQYSVREGRGILSTKLAEWLYGFRDLKIYQKQEETEAELRESMEKYEAAHERQQLQMAGGEGWNLLASLTATWAVVLVSVWQIGAGELDGIFLAMFIMISLMVFEDAGPMANVPRHLEDNRNAAERLFSLPGRTGRHSGDVSLESSGPLSFSMENVTYSFPESLTPALQDATISFPAGSKTAIVGASGSGKSTIQQLLLSMDVPEAGFIKVQGEDMQRVSQESVWKEVNAILQESHFFYGTVRDNLLLADKDADDRKMQEVLERVKLPHLSPEHPVEEKGGNLSGGEKQRLALARVYLKPARTWILDEPFSSVDALTESELMQDFWETAAQDTVILISHNLKGLEQMDNIVVVEQGQVIEKGSYEELMERKGYFYRMKQLENTLIG
ncbi:thiol reductant ABC exporter subunit CydC [Salimicrobium humidisoli]|uniref:Thiol reductant ABC exporter subunit CydC n=1 Tax=Salimicrobium humidisoli TaxID=2029857 RepID=A0ABX4HRX8_9BACI|nr:thiol reductant ABC exporter subunit CydC [Salimicrobium humidisoli]PBB05976.1 thiol reductant ABC exporter subunit CydC [Salimicrobium humidisoli]